MAGKVGNRDKAQVSTKIHTCHMCGAKGAEETHKSIRLAGPTGKMRMVRRCNKCN